MVFKWKIDGIVPVDAQTAGEELERIYKRDGKVSPETVLEDNSLPNTPLYNCFEWENEKAAHKYRVYQAQKIIKTIVAVSDNIEPETRAFVSVKNEYHPITTVMGDVEMKDVLLKNALLELKNFQNKYSSLKQLAKVFEAIKEVTE